MIIAFAVLVLFVLLLAYVGSCCPHTNATRHPRLIHSALRCPDCGKEGVSFDEMGYEHGYISRANPLLQRTR